MSLTVFRAILVCLFLHFVVLFLVWFLSFLDLSLFQLRILFCLSEFPLILFYLFICLILCVSADVMLNPMMVVACHLDIPKFCKDVEYGGGLGNIISCLKKNYKVRDWKFWSPSHLFAVVCFEFNLVCSTTRQIKEAFSVTPLFLFTSGNDKLNCLK